MHDISISYRRSDTEPVVERLYECLVGYFEKAEVFRDKQSIEAGADFPDALKAALDACKVALVVIGQTWLKSHDEFGRRRLDDPNDWVRREVETALASDQIRVIPVLVNNAPMPPSRALPDTLQKLVNKNAVMLRHDPDFATDVERLVFAIAKILNRPIQPLVPSPEVAELQAQAALETSIVFEDISTGHIRRVGGLPDHFDRYRNFYDRKQYLDDLTAQITDNARVIVLHGRHGVGKTALACTVLSKLGSGTLDGIISQTSQTLDGNPKPITLERIAADLGKLLPNFRGLVEPDMPPAQKVEAILSVAESYRIVLLLDDFQMLQDATDGRCTSQELDLLLTAVLRRGGLRVFITTTLPLTLRDRTYKGMLRQISLDKGLPTDDALALLQELLSEAMFMPDAAALRAIVGLTEGHPRALAAAAGWICDNPLDSLDDLVAQLGTYQGEVMYHLVGASIDTLPPGMRHVLEAVALFSQSNATAPALEYMLALCVDLTATPITHLLNALLLRGLVTYDPQSRTFGMPSTIRTYIASQIVESDTTCGRQLLLERGVDYFSQKSLSANTWQTIDDLAPLFVQFDFLVQLGAYDAAAELIQSFDYDYLLRWGFPQEVILMHSRLANRITHKSLQSASIGTIGIAYRDTGQLNMAVEYYETSLQLAREIGDAFHVSRRLGSLGVVHTALGNIERAIDYLYQALTIAESRDDQRSIGAWSGNLGYTHLQNGDFARSIAFSERAVAIADQLGDQHGRCFRFGNVGRAVAGLGDAQLAIAHLEGSFALAQSLQSPFLQTHTAIQLAEVFLWLNAPTKARDILRKVENLTVAQTRPTVMSLFGLSLQLTEAVDTARAVYGAALEFAANVLEQTSNLWAARYAMGLSQVGLFTLGYSDDLQPALDTYTIARTTCAATGVLSNQSKMLDLLITTPDGARIQRVRDLFD